MDDDLVLIETRLVGERLAVVLRRSRQLQSLGSVEGGRGSDLALLVRVVLELKLAFQRFFHRKIVSNLHHGG